MNVQVMCDGCRVVLEADKALWAVKSENDLCPDCYRKWAVEDLGQQARELEEWLEQTHHKSLREMREEITRLESGGDLELIPRGMRL